MGLIWNNEYVLEKNKELHKTGYSSTEATEMADNCFQVWHCSVNEFVLLCGRLTVSFLPFIFVSFSHTLFWFSSLCLCFLDIWPPYLPTPWLSQCPLFHFLSSQPFFTPFPLSQFHIRYRLFTVLLVVSFLCFACLLSANNRGILYFAMRCPQQIVYLDFSSLVLLYSPVINPLQQLKIPPKYDGVLSHCGTSFVQK